MHKYLAAHTPASPPAPAQVAYINAYLLDNGKVRITVRQQLDDPANEDVCHACIDMDPERALDFANELRAAMCVTADEMSFADLRASGGIVRDTTPFPVPTDSIERAQMKRPRKPL